MTSVVPHLAILVPISGTTAISLGCRHNSSRGSVPIRQLTEVQLLTSLVFKTLPLVSNCLKILRSLALKLAKQVYRNLPIIGASPNRSAPSV